MKKKTGRVNKKATIKKRPRNNKDLQRDNRILELKNSFLMNEIDEFELITSLGLIIPDVDKVKK
jgi:hypothetical protein